MKDLVGDYAHVETRLVIVECNFGVGVMVRPTPFFLKKIMVHKANKHLCQCGKSLDSLKEIGTDGHIGPREGDVAMCGYCGTISIFDKDLESIPATEEMLLILKRIDEKQYNNMMKYSNMIKELNK